MNFQISLIKKVTKYQKRKEIYSNLNVIFQSKSEASMIIYFSHQNEIFFIKKDT